MFAYELSGCGFEYRFSHFIQVNNFNGFETLHVDSYSYFTGAKLMYFRVIFVNILTLNLYSVFYVFTKIICRERRSSVQSLNLRSE